MKYPESALAADEIIVFDVHHHISVLLKPMLLFDVCLVAWIVLVANVSYFRRGWALLAGVVLLTALLAFGVWKLLVWIYTSLVLTDRRLVYRSGVFTRLSREIPLSRISDITTIQMFLGRIFSSGDLIITLDYSSGTEKSSFFRLPRPEKLKQDILKQAHALKAEAAGQENSSLASQIAHAVKREQPTYELPALPPERPPLYSEIVDQIERLDALRERGTLTDLEFEDAKQNLISRLKREPEN
jgi:uncharacterized membrane protein YdbT with pleckstrin-like domain